MHVSKELTDVSELRNTEQCVTRGYNIKMASVSYSIKKSIAHEASVTKSVNALEISVMQ